MKDWLKKIFSKKEKTCKPKSAIKRSILGAVALSVLGATVIAPTIASDTTSSPSPRFNFLSGDHELLTAANSTKGQSNWVDPVDGGYKADVGDEVVFRFYYHNGVLNSVARNTVLRALLPNKASTQHKVVTHLNSQDTNPITDTVVDGQIVGYGNGFTEINLAEAGRLEYVPGSTTIWDNARPNGAHLPDGVVTNDGINIGNIAGCWQYAGYVTFKAVVKAPADIAIEKYVAYPGSNAWGTILEDANEGETVAWNVRIGNFGDTVAKDVLARDALPSELSYINGTTILYNGESDPNGTVMPDTFTTSGFTIDEIIPGANNVITIMFQTKIGSNLPYGPQGVWEGVNWAYATHQGNRIGAHAKVTVVGEASLEINKTVWNGSNWVERNNANVGDIITYKIVVRNIGDLNQLNLRVNDVIPVYTKYIAGSTKVNGQSFADGVEGSGITLGKLAKDDRVIVTFEVLTYGCPPIGDYTLTNTAYATSSLVVGISDTAMTILHLDPVVGPGTGI